MFGVFLIGMLTCVIMGFVNGNVGKMMAPADADGNICGYNSTVVDYPYLYIYNLNAATKANSNIFDFGVCVESCPTQTSTINCVNTQVS